MKCDISKMSKEKDVSYYFLLCFDYCFYNYFNNFNFFYYRK